MKRRTRRRKSNQGMSPTSVGAFLSPRDEDVYYNLDYRASQPAPLRGEDAGFAQSVGDKMTETERKILETEPRSMPDHAARFSVRYTILTRDQGMRPDEAVMKALEDEGMREHVDAEKLVELMMR